MSNKISDPQNDREFMLKLDSTINHLTSVIAGLDDTLKSIKNKDLVELNKRTADLEIWKSELNGMWKMVIAIGVVSVIALIKSFFK